MIISQERLLEALRKVYPMDHLNPDQMKNVADKAEALVYKSDKIIYLQGSLGENIYLVIEGNVELLKEHNGNIIPINYFKPVSIFGYDAFSTDPVRRTSARSKTDSLVIRINAGEIRQIIPEDKNLSKIFYQILNGYLLMANIDLEGRKPDETIHFAGRFFPYKQLLLFLISLSCTLALGIIINPFNLFKGINILENAVMIVLIGFFIVMINIIPYMNWKGSKYVITDQRVILKELSILMFENRHEMGLKEIVGVSERTNVIGRMLNVGDLIINSYTGNLEIRNIRYSGFIQKIVEKLQTASSEMERMSKQGTFDALITDRVGISAGVASAQKDIEFFNQENITPVNKEPGFIEKIIGLKVYQGDRILFRTHWIELLKRILIPTVLLTSFQIFLAYMSSEQILWASNQYVLFLSIGLMITMMAWWIYLFVDWRNDRFIITKDQIIDINQKPFGLEDKRTAPINRIQSIRYKRQGLAGLLFNYGTVYIRIGDDELTFDHVHNPLSIQQEIFQRLENIKRSNEEKILANQRDQVTNLIEAYHRITPKK